MPLLIHIHYVWTLDLDLSTS